MGLTTWFVGWVILTANNPDPVSVAPPKRSCSLQYFITNSVKQEKDAEFEQFQDIYLSN